jgi:oligopeptide/dipeptide ABC transporter ATP-binding protein
METTKQNELLKVKNLKMYFYLSQGQVKAVDDIDLTVSKKSAVGLVGESGCGKTATALSIVRLLPSPPSKILEGKVLFKGSDLLKLSEKELRKIRGKEISIVFQDPMTFLNPVLKVSDQIGETIREHQVIRKRDVKNKIIELLDHVGIPGASDVIDYYPHQLSGGMRQRVLIAMALSCNPSLVIMDEPTTALDVTIQRQILELIKGLIKDYDMSLLLITHDLGVVAEICDYIYIMYAGRIVEQADVYTIFESAKHPYTIGLLSSALSIEEHKKELIGLDGNVPDLINPPLGCKFHPRCSYIKETCREEEPPLTEIKPGHYVRCWLDQ